MLVVAMLPPLSPVSMLATPSIVMLFEFGRWPLTVNPLTWPISLPGVGVLRERAGHEQREVEQHAPVVGDVLQRLVLERERALAARRLQLADAAETVTSSVMAPTSSASMPAEKLVVRVDDDVGPLGVLKPCSVALSV